MTSFRRVAFPLGLVAVCGGALLFSLSTAKGQSAAPTSPGAPPSSASPGSAPVSGGSPLPGSLPSSGSSISTGVSGATASAGSPQFKQTIGISPTQIGRKSFIVIGGTGNDSYDLQNENVYSLLRQRGVPIPNILHPLSTAKPSFILERLMVFSLTGGNNSTGAGAAPGASVGRGGAPSVPGAAAGGAAAAPAGPTDAEKTVTSVRLAVEAELAQGTGRLGGAHRQKLTLLRNAIVALERGNKVGSVVSQAIGGGIGVPGGGTAEKSKLDPREIFYGQARLEARKADLYTPSIP